MAAEAEAREDKATMELVALPGPAMHDSTGGEDQRANKPSTEAVQEPADEDSKRPSKHSEHLNAERLLREFEAKFNSLDLFSRARQGTTHGHLRLQLAVSRKTDANGEKRTVETWIEITQVYEIPAVQQVSFTDVLAYAEAERKYARKYTMKTLAKTISTERLQRWKGKE